MDKGDFMRACREGGAAIEAALRAIDRSFFGALYRESLRVLRRPDDAHDAVQDAMIKVWQRCASYHGDAELLPWMRAVLRHTLLDALRARGDDRPLEHADGSVDPEIEARIAELSAASVPTPVDALQRQQQAALFLDGWQRFEADAPAHAAVLRWIAEDGLAPAEIAELLGRTPGATREFISQARKRARRHLADWHALTFGTSELQ